MLLLLSLVWQGTITKQSAAPGARQVFLDLGANWGDTIDLYRSVNERVRPWGGKAWNSSHHRGSADKVAEYYTPELAGLVFDIQREDFVNFGYPAWNGDKHTFRYVR